MGLTKSSGGYPGTDATARVSSKQASGRIFSFGPRIREHPHGSHHGGVLQLASRAWIRDALGLGHQNPVDPQGH